MMPGGALPLAFGTMSGSSMSASSACSSSLQAPGWQRSAGVQQTTVHRELACGMRSRRGVVWHDPPSQCRLQAAAAVVQRASGPVRRKSLQGSGAQHAAACRAWAQPARWHPLPSWQPELHPSLAAPTGVESGWPPETLPCWELAAQLGGRPARALAPPPPRRRAGPPTIPSICCSSSASTSAGTSSSASPPPSPAPASTSSARAAFICASVSTASAASVCSRQDGAGARRQRQVAHGLEAAQLGCCLLGLHPRHMVHSPRHRRACRAAQLEGGGQPAGAGAVQGPGGRRRACHRTLSSKAACPVRLLCRSHSSLERHVCRLDRRASSERTRWMGLWLVGSGDGRAVIGNECDLPSCARGAGAAC